MAKQIKEFRNFLLGTNSSPSASDIPDESPTYSLNLESLDEEGKLKGSKRSIALKVGDVSNNYIVSLGGTATLVDNNTFTYNILGTTDSATANIVNAGDWLAWKTLRKAFVSKVNDSQYVQSAELLSGFQDTNDGSFTQSAYIDSNFDLEQNLNGTDTTTVITFTSATYVGHVFDVGNKIAIGSEYMLITAVQTPEDPGTAGYTFKLTVTRGVFGTVDANGDPVSSTITSHNSGADIQVQMHFGSMKVVWHPDVEDITDIKFTLTTEGGTTTLPYLDESQYLEVNARNLIFIDNKDPNSTIVTSDVLYYDKNTTSNPPEYKMKVIENFYRDNNAPRRLTEPEISSVNSTNSGYPESVSLAKGPNAVHIGTGATSSSKPQWMGKINHSQFGSKVDGYILEDAELKAIDDGESIFNIKYVESPYLDVGGAVNRTQSNYVTGITGVKKKIYGLFMNHDYSNADTVGKQFISNNIPFTPSAIASSKALTDFFKDSNNTSKTPFDSGAWTASNDENTLQGHDEQTSYYLVGSRSEPDKIYIVAGRLHLDSQEPKSFLIHSFGWFKLEHHTVIDSTLAPLVALDVNDKINRPPKNGSYINDIYEKNGQIYIQYGHASGFTFDEEFLYTFPVTAMTTHSGSTMGDSTKITAKPITPPVMQLKNWGKDFRNRGQDWYANDECCDFGNLHSSYDIGWDGYNNYTNKIKWRGIDIMGFLPNKKHCKYEREIYDNASSTWSIVEPDTSGYYNTYYGYTEDGWFSADDAQYIPGYSSASNRQDNQPRRGGDNKWDNGYMAPTFGFETYSVFTQLGGITNLESNDDTPGAIGLSVFIDGKQITSDITMNRHYQKTTFPFRKYHSLRNTTTPVIETVSENKILTADTESFGVAQRVFPVFPAGKKTYLAYDSYESGSQGFKNINGMDTVNWSGGETADSDNSVNWGDGVVKAWQKFTWRYGCYSPGRDAPNTHVNRRNYKIYNNAIINLGTASGPSSDNNTDYIARAGDDANNLIGVHKNYKGLNDFITTNLTLEMDKVNTYISRWPLLNALPSAGSYGMTTLTPVTNLNPLKVLTVGAATIQNIYTQGTSQNDSIGLWGTAGRLISGDVEYIFQPDSYNTNSNTAETALYGDQFFPFASGELSTGLTPTFIDETDLVTDVNDADGDNDTTDTIYSSGNFNAGTTYYWKISLLYDGYQEGPLSQAEFALPATIKNYNSAQLDLELSVPPKRVNALVIYRKNGINEYYRMVAEVDLSKGWNYDAVKDVYKKSIVDDGRQGATYEAITGLSETLQNTIVHYGLSTVAQGHLIVADCWHPEIKQGQNFVFKSEPNAFSNFNWAKNYCVMPAKPTALTWFANKLYVFDLNNMYRVNLDNLVLEDTFEGIGCIGQDSLIVTDMGMFFCDYQGLYWHNGQKAENIGVSILKNSYAEDNTADIPTNINTDLNWQKHPWQNINHDGSPKVVYDPKTLTVYYCFKDKYVTDTGDQIFNGAWKFNITRKRWDLVSLPTINGVLTGKKNDSYISGDYKLYQLAKADIERNSYEWSSKKFDMGAGSEDKVFYSIKLVLNNNSEAQSVYNSGTTENILDIYTSKTNNSAIISSNIKKSLEENTVTYNIKGSDRKAKWLKFKLTTFKYEVDSIALTYRLKGIK